MGSALEAYREECPSDLLYVYWHATDRVEDMKNFSRVKKTWFKCCILFLLDEILEKGTGSNNNIPRISELIGAAKSAELIELDFNENKYLDLVRKEKDQDGQVVVLSEEALKLAGFAPVKRAFITLATKYGFIETSEKAAPDYLVSNVDRRDNLIEQSRRMESERDTENDEKPMASPVEIDDTMDNRASASEENDSPSDAKEPLLEIERQPGDVNTFFYKHRIGRWISKVVETAPKSFSKFQLNLLKYWNLRWLAQSTAESTKRFLKYVLSLSIRNNA
jgi:hypothetical protein